MTDVQQQQDQQKQDIQSKPIVVNQNQTQNQQPVQQQIQLPQAQQQIIYQPTVVTTTTTIIQKPQYEVLTCQAIMCQCKPPQALICQKLWGCQVAFSCGICLQCLACSVDYGYTKSDRCEVCLSGCGFTVTAPVIYGIIGSFIVGFRMMKCF